MRIRRIQCRLARLYIGFPAPDPSRPLDHLPHQKQRRENRHAHIRCDEIVQIERLRLARECVEPVQDHDHHEEEQREPGGVGLEGGFEDQGVTGDTLGAQGGVEADVGYRDGHPGEEGGDGCEILEPGEDGGCAGSGGHVG